MMTPTATRDQPTHGVSAPPSTEKNPGETERSYKTQWQLLDTADPGFQLTGCWFISDEAYRDWRVRLTTPLMA